jgi:hypothetical protein
MTRDDPAIRITNIESQAPSFLPKFLKPADIKANSFESLIPGNCNTEGLRLYKSGPPGDGNFAYLSCFSTQLQRPIWTLHY